jgi:hypothetical protein
MGEMNHPRRSATSAKLENHRKIETELTSMYGDEAFQLLP